MATPQSAVQGDLFGPPLLPGLSLAENIVDAAEETCWIERMRGARLEPFQFQQWTGKRLTRSFGWSYDFITGRFAPAEPIPGWLEPARERAAAFVGIATGNIAQALLIEYGDGAGIGWHRDRPVFEHIIGISLGAAATMRFRKRREDGFDRAAMPLAPRSMYWMSGEARSDWEHGIAGVSAPRWSITFRTLRGT